MITILLAIELILLIEVYIRIRALCAAKLLMLYIFVSQFVFWFGVELGFDQNPGPEALFSFIYIPDTVVQIYFLMFLIAYVSTIGICVARGEELPIAFSSILRRYQTLILAALLLLYLLALLHLGAMNKTILISNSRYLALLSADELAVNNTITRIVSNLFPLLSICAVMIASIAFLCGNYKLGYSSLPLCLWYFLLSVANGSRHAAVLLAIPAILAAVFVQRRRALVVGFFSMLSFLAVFLALKTRYNGQFGLSALPGIFVGIMDANIDDIQIVMANIFQGILITGDGLSIIGEHSFTYKLLSFSPLPAFIDHFDEIRELQEIRLHFYVPMSAVTEVVRFGIVYCLIAGVSLGFALRLNLLALRAGHRIAGTISTAWIVLIFIQANAYPLRNVYRQLLLAILFLLMSGPAARLWTALTRRTRGAVGHASESADTVGSDGKFGLSGKGKGSYTDEWPRFQASGAEDLALWRVSNPYLRHEDESLG